MLGAISRMKSLIAPPFSPISKVSSPSSPFFSLASKSKISPLPTIHRKPIDFPLKTPAMLSIFPFQNRCLQSQSFPSSSSGEIHVIVGPMFAGKTTTLLRRMQSESEDGRNVAIIKSNKDTRYCLDSIVTHDGVKLPCVPLTTLSSFRKTIGKDAYEELDVIGIDEAQFFEDLYDFCREAADHDGKTVVVAGLDGDYLRRSFGCVLDIIPLADSVLKLTSRCEFCGKPAFFTLRKTEESQVELIGGADVYMPVCRQHYVSGQVVVEASRIVLESSKVESCV